MKIPHAIFNMDSTIMACIFLSGIANEHVILNLGSAQVMVFFRVLLFNAHCISYTS